LKRKNKVEIAKNRVEASVGNAILVKKTDGRTETD